jgi:predicted nucleotidyltransferase
MSVDPEAIQSLQGVLASLNARPDVRLVILFGSSVKGPRHSRSDLDLAILADGLLDILDMTNQMIALSRNNCVDVVDLRRASPLLAMEVVKGGRLLYEREAGLYAEFCSMAHRRYVDTAKLRTAQKEAIACFLQRRGLA